MKQYFSLKSLFLGAALLVSGTIGLISNASAHDSHHNERYSNNKHHDKHRYDYRGKKRWGQQRHYSDKRQYHRKNRHQYRYQNRYQGRHETGRYHGDRDYRNRHDYDKGFSRPQRSKKQCFNFHVKAIGGNGGFRFQHNIKDFKRLGRHGYSGKICGHRHAEFELSKVDPGVKVVMKINGKRFVYGAHSGHDRYINTWHRKYYSVRLGH